MRLQAATAAALALALISTGSLLAKPTRTLARPAAHIVQPAGRVSRERSSTVAHVAVHARPAGGPGAGHATTAGRSKAQIRNVRKTAAATQPAIRTTARGKRLSRSRKPAAERQLATHTATPASDRVSRTTSRDPGPQPSEAPASPLSSALALTNFGGILRPTPGSQPLKSIEDEAATPVLLPGLRVSSLYDSAGRLIMPRPLYGTHEILLHQNEMADQDGLDRVRNDVDLIDLRRQKKLVAIPESAGLRVDFRLPEGRRYSRPWTAAFLSVIAADFYASFHMPLQVDSAVRTIAVQQRLQRTNGNAAPSSGDTASPHLTGQAVDIAKGGLTQIQIAWMRTYLQPLIDLGRIDVEEEFKQSCFHISVYRSFLPAPPERLSVAAASQPAPGDAPARPAY